MVVSPDFNATAMIHASQNGILPADKRAFSPLQMNPLWCDAGPNGLKAVRFRLNKIKVPGTFSGSEDTFLVLRRVSCERSKGPSGPFKVTASNENV
jgi:hypothetical protein